jgi:hypothetical protein
MKSHEITWNLAYQIESRHLLARVFAVFAYIKSMTLGPCASFVRDDDISFKLQCTTLASHSDPVTVFISRFAAAEE